MTTKKKKNIFTSLYSNYTIWSILPSFKYCWIMEKCLFCMTVIYRQVFLNNSLMGSEWVSQPHRFSASLWKTPTSQLAARNTEIWSHHYECCFIFSPISSPLCSSTTQWASYYVDQWFSTGFASQYIYIYISQFCKINYFCIIVCSPLYVIRPSS